jgi:hypothetical protein
MSQSVPNKGLKLRIKMKKNDQNDPKKIIERISHFGKTDISNIEFESKQADHMVNETDDDRLNPNHNFVVLDGNTGSQNYLKHRADSK